MTRIKEWFLTSLLMVYTGVIPGRSEPMDPNPRACFLIHGLGASALSLKYLQAKIEEHNPRTEVYNTDSFSNASSLIPLQKQLDGGLLEEFKNFSDRHREKFNLIGHSQGCMLARTLVESYPEHNVHTLILVAGVNGGQYGLPGVIKLVERSIQLPPILQLGSSFFYTKLGQKTVSISGYWNDPFDHEEYLRQNTFLPRFNNEVITDKSASYKEAFTKLERLVTIQGPDDGFIIPWESGDFSFFNSSRQVVNYSQREIYTKDLFGLQTLDKAGKWLKFNVPGVEHIQFVFDDNVINNFILPFL